MKRRLTRIGNRIGAWMYRTLNGRLASSRKTRVLLLTTPGRRTGRPRSTCVRYLDTDEGFLVWGTASGAPRDPDWFLNLRKSWTADVQVGSRHLRVLPRELVGEEREDAWTNVILATAPSVARYATKANRIIPVAILKPLDDQPER